MVRAQPAPFQKTNSWGMVDAADVRVKRYVQPAQASGLIASLTHPTGAVYNEGRQTTARLVRWGCSSRGSAVSFGGPGQNPSYGGSTFQAGKLFRPTVTALLVLHLAGFLAFVLTPQGAAGRLL